MGTVTAHTVTFQQMHIAYIPSLGGTVPTMPGVYLYTCSLTDRSPSPTSSVTNEAALPRKPPAWVTASQKSGGCGLRYVILLHFTGDDTRKCGP